MRAVIQRVSSAEVWVEDRKLSSINRGILVLVGFSPKDTENDFQYIRNKILNLRIFPDSKGIMNLSVQETNGDILLVSQFTLYADARKGRSPSYSSAAPPEIARGLWEKFVEDFGSSYSGVLGLGEF